MPPLLAYGLVIARVRPQCYQRLDSDKGHGFKHDGRTGGGYVGGLRCRGSSRFRRGDAETRQKGGQKCAVFSFFLLLKHIPRDVSKPSPPQHRHGWHPSGATHPSLGTALRRGCRRDRSGYASPPCRHLPHWRPPNVRTQGKVPTIFST